MTSGTRVASGSTSASHSRIASASSDLIRRLVADRLVLELDLERGILGAEDGRDLLADVLFAQARRDAAIDDDLSASGDHVVGWRGLDLVGTSVTRSIGSAM